MVNCLTMGMNVVTLFVYFLHGREIKMLWVSLLVFMSMPVGGIARMQIQAIWLVILTLNKKVEGKLLEVESLRCVFLDISKSLNRLGAAPPTRISTPAEEK
ncbi:uncharacterized protein LOC120669496 [Panicum virgatum]|uniref:uncharacterized protein LOC120669496 n=1 Tax=Panicum virgatum TaxID=38727 RepID=UPI0019D5D6FF|nr:uncharacterized protein LOC120669496 [Panicum virgatum]